MAKHHYYIPVGTKEDAHAPSAAREPSTHGPPHVFHEPDPIELECSLCTLTWRDGHWSHENSCPARRIQAALG